MEYSVDPIIKGRPKSAYNIFTTCPSGEMTMIIIIIKMKEVTPQQRNDQ